MLDKDFENVGLMLSYAFSSESPAMKAFTCRCCGEVSWILSDRPNAMPTINPHYKEIGCAFGPRYLGRTDCAERNLPFNPDKQDGLFEPEYNRKVSPTYYAHLCSRPEGHDWVRIQLK